MSRLPQFLPDDLDTEQRAVYDAITGGPRATGAQFFALTGDDGGLRGPFNAFLLSPQIGSAIEGLGASVRFGSTLSPQVRELSILIVAARWNSEFERVSHEAVARGIGIPESALSALRAGECPETADPYDSACVRLAWAMAHGDIDDATWERESAMVSARHVFELSTVVGYYAMLALQLRVFRVIE